MYKTEIISFKRIAKSFGGIKTELIEEVANEWLSKGYELVSITPIPWLTGAERCDFLLTFKNCNNRLL